MSRVETPAVVNVKVTSTQSLAHATTLPSALTAAAKTVVETLLEPSLSSVASAQVCSVAAVTLRVSAAVTVDSAAAL